MAKKESKVVEKENKRVAGRGEAKNVQGHGRWVTKNNIKIIEL